MGRTLSIKLMSMLLILSFSFSMPMTSVGAQSSTTQLYVNPPKVEYWTPSLGATFKINVSIANVSDLIAFEFKLYWNTTLLDLVKVDVQPFLNPPTAIFHNEINETAGRYWLFVYSTGFPKNGSGALATLSFKITYDPIWPENVTSVLNLNETFLYDSSIELIPHNVYDGEYSYHSLPPLRITIMTEKPSYYPNEVVHIYGNLTLGFSPVPDGLVALEVDDPENGIIAIRSLSTGIPPATQIIEIVNVIPCGGPPNYNPKNSFRRGEMAHFNITIKNNDNKTRRVLVALSVYDVNVTPLLVPGVPMVETSVYANNSTSIIFDFSIPDAAAVGEARVYANALTAWPSIGGTAYCPEKSATFNILGSSSSRTTQSSSNTSEGNYNLTFKFPPGQKFGNYTIYANSNYTVHEYTQKVTNTLKFQVKAPPWDVDGNRIVNILDILVVAVAFGSQPGSPKWNPRADVAAPWGLINVLDILLVAIHFGESV